MRSQFLIPLMSVLAISLTAPIKTQAGWFEDEKVKTEKSNSKNEQTVLLDSDGTMIIPMELLRESKQYSVYGVNVQATFSEYGSVGIVNGALATNSEIVNVELCSKLNEYSVSKGNDFSPKFSEHPQYNEVYENSVYKKYLNNPVSCKWVRANNARKITAYALTAAYCGKEDFNYTCGGRELMVVVNIEISRIQVKSSAAGGLMSFNISEDLKAATVQVIATYRKALEQLSVFEANIGKSQRGHLKRLKQALGDAITRMSDAKGNPLIPVTHDSVREDARMIMVFATVLNELLEDYSDVATIQNQVKNLAALSQQIRSAYGWNTGLVGGGSKAIASLAAVVDLEMRELYNLMASFGQVSSAEPFFNLIKRNSAVSRAVNAKNGGDAAAKVEIAKFVDEWNKAEWQAMIATLLNAPQDQRGFVQPKLRLLLMAMESLSDLAQVQIIITDTNISGKK